MNKTSLVMAIVVTLSGCSTATREVVNVPAAQPRTSPTLAVAEEKSLRRKVAIARFSNETKHGNSFLLDANQDRIGKQATDILSARLTETGKFLMFERADLARIKAEQDLANVTSEIVGADFLIVGSVSEFGRSTVSEVGIFSRNKKQKASATVNVRLIDVTTGQIIFSEEGSGEAISEANRVFGVGASAGYDSELDDKALSAAISKLVSNLIENLLDTPWVAYVLDVSDGQIVISGGKSQGIAEGDEFVVQRRGKRVKNNQTGLIIELPGTEIARLRVVATTGTGNNEVSVCALLSGSIPDRDYSELKVVEP